MARIVRQRNKKSTAKKTPSPFSDVLPDQLSGETHSNDIDGYTQWLDAKHEWRERIQRGEIPDEPDPPKDIARTMRDAWVVLLKSVMKGERRLPGDMAFQLHDALLELEAGQGQPFLIPGLIRHKGYRNKNSHLYLDRYRQDATEYLKAVQEGRIKDEHPNVTVGYAFNVHPDTVSRWKKKYPDVEVTNTQKVITTKMRRSGRFYANHLGRGK